MRSTLIDGWTSVTSAKDANGSHPCPSGILAAAGCGAETSTGTASVAGVVSVADVGGRVVVSSATVVDETAVEATVVDETAVEATVLDETALDERALDETVLSIAVLSIAVVATVRAVATVVVAWLDEELGVVFEEPMVDSAASASVTTVDNDAS